ncbi:MAG TPA: hypothetical protein VL993_14460 [Stellaceae bacterium]|nr:hypothetical protein [Stellaceae bacterium]
MSPSEGDRAARVSELASELSAMLSEAVDENRLGDVPDDALGQVFAAVVRFYGAKCQDGDAPPPFARNMGVTVTDVMIGCTAMLEAVNSLVFELGLWQSWTSLGKRKQHVDNDAEIPS